MTIPSAGVESVRIESSACRSVRWRVRRASTTTMIPSAQQARTKASAALVIGDDRTDAEAFRRVTGERRAGRLAASLLLGVRGARETPPELLAAADVILPEPAASAIVLRALARTLEAEERPHRER